MDAMAGIYRNVYRCLKELDVEYKSFSVSVSDGIEIIVDSNEAKQPRLGIALACIEEHVPPAWKTKIRVKVIE